MNIKYDIYRYYGKYNINFYNKLCLPISLKYIFILRRAQNCFKNNNKILKKYYLFRLRKFEKLYQFQISPAASIGYGLYIGHTGRLIINGKVKIGNNCNLGTGITIGMENRGKRKGAPIIGNKVWIGNNVTIVGKIKIGDNVLIAPNSFVNFDVPSNSIVIGNPGKIILKDKAVDGYIENIVVK